MECVYCAVRTESLNLFIVANFPLLPSVLMMIVVLVVIIIIVIITLLLLVGDQFDAQFLL